MKPTQSELTEAMAVVTAAIINGVEGGPVAPPDPQPEPTPEPEPTPAPSTGFALPLLAAPQVSGPAEDWSTWEASASATEFGPKRIASGGTLTKMGYGGAAPNGMHLHDIDADRAALVTRAAHMQNATFERIKIREGRYGSSGVGIATLWGLVGHLTVKDVAYYGPSEPMQTNDILAFIALKGKPRYDANGNPTGNTEANIDIENGGGTFDIDGFDFHNLPITDTSYPNTDGISTERVYSGTIRNGTILNVMDACLDLKGDVRADNVSLSVARNGIKAWQDQHHGTVEFGTFRHACVFVGKWTGDHSRTITFDYADLTDPTTAFLGGDGEACHAVLRAGRWLDDQKWFAGDCPKGSTVTLPDGTVLRN
jgi:hypothetical protein